MKYITLIIILLTTFSCNTTRHIQGDRDRAEYLISDSISNINTVDRITNSKNFAVEIDYTKTYPDGTVEVGKATIKAKEDEIREKQEQTHTNVSSNDIISEREIIKEDIVTEDPFSNYLFKILVVSIFLLCSVYIFRYGAIFNR